MYTCLYRTNRERERERAKSKHVGDGAVGAVFSHTHGLEHKMLHWLALFGERQ